ncbi:MAG: hypothetical protein RBT78_08785 [Kiritimatiellia bacterium]|nr:hypothetical protein [Kiritimatiellia bacterium]
MRCTRKRLTGTVVSGLIGVLAVSLAQPVRAANNVVPKAWGTAPMTDGAYLEAFETLPSWADVGYNEVVEYSFSGITFPERSNVWFSAHAKVLSLDTDSMVVTNALAHTDASAISFTADPVFVDMRVKFETLSDPPGEETVSNAKLALFVEPEGKLVVTHNAGAYTNATAFDTNEWYQVTIKMHSTDQFDVLLNDEALVSGLTVKSGAGTANTLEAVNFRGTGLIDDLYVSRGDPMYAITGPTTALAVTLPDAGANPPTGHEQTLINLWLQGKASLESLGSMTQDELSQAYLLDALGGTESTAAAVSFDFGIAQVDLNSPTSLTVTMSLKVDAAGKSGPINGRVQVYGRTTLAGSPVAIGDPVRPTFSNGAATHTVTISEGYRFFDVKIIP